MAKLNRLSFSHYDGVIVPTPMFVEWFASRPGMDPRLCQAAFAGDELVSSVLVTLAKMRLAGRMVLCGILDEVMTHPDHRRRGLARALIQRALVAMGARGAEVSLLNTLEATPPSGPQQLYESSGYQVYERVDRFEVTWGRPEAPAVASKIPPDGAARAAVESALGERDGWLELNDELWRWRRAERALDSPGALYRAAGGGFGAWCGADLTFAGHPKSCTVLSDIVLPPGDHASEDLAELVAVSSRGLSVTVLCPRSDPILGRLLRQQGFAVVGTELAMLRPFSDDIARHIQRGPDCWYVAVESIIGV
jgi:GNAT superfamily N-acetyltransferase